MTDERIVRQLAGNIKERNEALTALFEHEKYQGSLIAFIKSKGLKGNDVDDIFSETIVKFSLVVKKNKYEEKGAMLGYLMSIANFLILDFFKKRPLVIGENQIPDGIIFQGHFEIRDLFVQLLDRIGELCRSILTFWSEGYRMKEIAEKMNIISETAVRKRKHKCLKDLLHIVDQDEELKSVLRMYLEEYD